jgi:hypothetical protein
MFVIPFVVIIFGYFAKHNIKNLFSEVLKLKEV